MKYFSGFSRGFFILSILLVFIALQVPKFAEAYYWIPQVDLGTRNWASVTSSDDGQKLAAVATNGNIYTSSNGGLTWATSTGAGITEWRSITSSADGQKLFAVAGGTNIYNSTTSGATWATLPLATVGVWNGVSSSDDGLKIAAISDNGYISISTTSGATWTPQISLGIKFWRGVASSANGTKIVAVDSGYYGDYTSGQLVQHSDGYIYISGDSGSTWASSTGAGFRRWWGVASSDDGTKLAAVAWGGYIYTSTTSGATWATSTASGSRNWAGITSSADGSRLAAVVNSGSIYVSTDGGNTWEEQPDTSTSPLTLLNYWSGITSSADGKNFAAVAAGYSGYLYLSSAVSEPQVAVSSSTATVTFNTVDNSNSTVTYGPTSSYGSSTISGTNTKNHSGELTNLTCDSTYHYQVSAIDGSSTETTLIDKTFKTQRCSNVIVVTTLTDDGDGTCTANSCTFRDAINNSEAGNVIEFGNLTGSIVMDQDLELNIDHNLTIAGPGADILTLDFNNLYSNEIKHTDGDLNISGLNIVNQAQDAIWEQITNAGTLMLSDVKFTNIIGDYSPLYISNSDNVTLNHCEFTNNTVAYGNGGAIFGANGNITINNSTFSENTTSGNGGAVDFENGGVGDLNITNSTFENNTAGSYGAIVSYANNTNITNSTFSNSDASSTQDYSVFISGISNITNSIFYSINDNNCAGAYTSGGHNIDSGSSCGFDQSGDISLASNILLDPAGLKDNGGLVKTIALMTGSSAIDSADNAKAPATDARGALRPQDGDNNGSLIADMGAYEVGVISTSTATSTPDSTPTPTPTVHNQTSSSQSSSGSVVYGCKDPKASNYEYFVSSRPSLCRYDSMASSTLVSKNSSSIPTISPTTLTSRTSLATFLRDLKLGMTGQDVKMLQQFLNNNNFIVTKSGAGSKGKETTKFGPATKSALIKYQKANKITPAVGYFGPKTRSVIKTSTIK